MAKYIDKTDLDNGDLNLLPIRKGCSGGPCACLGTCRNIVGYVDRNEYEEFIRNYVTLDNFLFQRCENNG